MDKTNVNIEGKNSEIAMDETNMITEETVVDKTTGIAVESKHLLDTEYPGFVERYFNPLQCNNVRGTEDDYCVLVHSNRVCLVTLANTHKLKKADNIPVKVDFQISDKINREDNAMTGKGKRGAQQLSNNSVLCHVTCDDGTMYPLHAAVAGKLLDINTELLEKPALIKDAWIAIVLPTIPTFESFQIPLKNHDGFYDEDCDS